jgi:hypothetical protein
VAALACTQCHGHVDDIRGPGWRQQGVAGPESDTGIVAPGSDIWSAVETMAAHEF